MLLYFLFAVAIVSYRNVVAQFGMGMGPLNVRLVDVKACEGHKGYLDITFEDIGGGKTGVNIDIDLPQPMDDTISYEIRVDKIQNGQIQKAVFRHGGKNACVDLDKFVGVMWSNLIKASGAPEGCPTPAGKYHVDKYPYNADELNIKTFLYGRFLLNLQMFIKGELAVCQVIEFTNNRPGESV